MHTLLDIYAFIFILFIVNYDVNVLMPHYTQLIVIFIDKTSNGCKCTGANVIWIHSRWFLLFVSCSSIFKFLFSVLSTKCLFIFHFLLPRILWHPIYGIWLPLWYLQTFFTLQTK